MNIKLLYIYLFYIQYIFCCYTNKTYYKSTYELIPTKTLSISYTTKCDINYETNYNINPKCYVGLYNYGMNCKGEKTIKPTTSCYETSSENYISTNINKPTSIAETFLYKIDCKNKTYSSLISIIR